MPEGSPTTLFEHVLAQETWLVIWVFWLIILNTASILFVWRHVEARWVLLAFLVNGPIMNYLFGTYGFVRLLGLSHVIVWTPLLVYLWMRRERFDRRTFFGGWVLVLMITDGISLVVDYIDVVRYALGDGALPQ